MNMQAEWRDRLRYWTHALTQDLYHPLGDIPMEHFFTYDQLSTQDAETQRFSPIAPGTKWGMEWEYMWLKSSITLPEEAKGKTIVLDLKHGGESTIFVNGKAFGTKRAEWVSVPHHFVEDNFLTESAVPGQQYDLLIEAYAGHYVPEGVLGGIGVGPVLPGSYQDPLKDQPRQTLGRSTYGIWNELAHQLWLDVTTLQEVMVNLPDSSLRAAKIEKGLKDFSLAVDFEQPLAGRLSDYAKGREILAPLLAAENGTTAPTFYGIGNSHLDVVWLWPFQETVRKTARTFAQQLRLLEKYPDYQYLQSQPQTYLMCKEHYPELYQRIKEAVAKGQWIVEGGMWVEPDTNMSSGEALIRQLLYGMDFFKKEFGVDCEILWLPDTFGYSAVLPQILKNFGIKYLVTQKIFWSYNDGERFPYHYFTWQGNDGSEVISYLPTSYTYKTNPTELMEIWENRAQRDDMDKFLLPYGYGDGGGGPTRDYIEYAQRQANLEGAPKVKLASPNQLFYDLEVQGGPQHKYTGELYFSAHRGVYTSQATVKWGNRKSELAMREAELWQSLAAVKSGAAYAKAEIEGAWKKILLNQFHDILPGSSIGRAYVEAAVLHEQAIATGESAASAGKTALAGESDAYSVFNSLSWDRCDLVALPEIFAAGAQTAEGTNLPVCVTEDHRVLAYVPTPSCGYTVLTPAATKEKSITGVRLLQENGKFTLENQKIRVVFNENAEITSFVTKETRREYAASPMNRFLLYKDVPRKFDAWDIDSPYEEQLIDLDAAAEIQVVENTALRCVLKVSKTISNSQLSQTITLDYGSDRLVFDTTVDWKELHRLLKVSFPVEVYATEAYNEIQFGYVKRPTHRSRQYDKDRFEVCNHKYTALFDGSHGAAVLNDCKYGVSMRDNEIALTLLRAAGAPELQADNRVHHFTYAFAAFDSSFEESNVVQQGYELNVPVTDVPGGKESQSFCQIDDSNVILETVKLAEDGSGDLILRIYEAMRADTTTTLYLDGMVSAAVCTMNEAIVHDLPTENESLQLHLKPFEILTLRCKLS